MQRNRAGKSIDFRAVLGHPYEFKVPGITIKPYPACTRSHPAIDAALELAAKRPSIDGIESIDCDVAPAVLQVVTIASPRNPMEAKFSLPCCIAASLCDGEMVMEMFTEDRLDRPHVQGLMKKVQPRVAAELSARGSFAARVLLHMKDGSVLQAEKDRNLWDEVGVASAEKRRQLIAKYRDCAGRVLGDGEIEKTVQIVDALEAQQHLDELFRIVRAGVAGQQARMHGLSA